MRWLPIAQKHGRSNGIDNGASQGHLPPAQIHGDNRGCKFGASRRPGGIGSISKVDPMWTHGGSRVSVGIDYEEGLRALHFFLEQRPEPSPPTTTLLRLAERVVTNFSFNSSQFLQSLHLRHICSEEATFDKRASEMSTFFLNQGLPTSVVDRALQP
eukprot:g40558.t1